MRFPEYVAQAPRGEMKRIERETGIGYTTLQKAAHGSLIHEYPKAKKISEATGGAVTIAELCDGPPAVPDAANDAAERDAV